MEPDDFLKKKGAVDLMFEVSEGPKTFNELVYLIRLGPNTVLSRLREAQTLGLVEEKLTRKEKGRSSISYKITEAGKRKMKDLEIIKKDYIKLREELKKMKAEEKEKERKINSILSTAKNSINLSIGSNNNIKSNNNINISPKINLGKKP